MPGLLSEKFKNKENTKKAVEEKVKQEEYTPTQQDNEIIETIISEISSKFRDTIAQNGFSDKIKEEIKIAVEQKCQTCQIGYEEQKRIERYALSSIIGYGPLDTYIDDPEVTEIVVQRYDNICIEKKGIVYKTKASFADEAQLKTVIDRILQPIGRQINLFTPMVDGRLPNGSRVNATIPPVTPDGATLTIRKFSTDVLSGQDLINFDSLNIPMLKFLSKCVKSKISLIVSGGTSTGKTTLLNVLSSFIPNNELIITIEDSCELSLKQPNVRRMEARAVNGEGMQPITIQSLVRNSLRMRPDRIIVGEIRDGTVVDMMSAMSTGHEGSMSTVHANSPVALVNSRIPILYSMNSNYSFAESSQKVQIVEALQLIIQITRLDNGERKISQITEVAGLENGKILLRDIFVYDKKNKQFKATGYIPKKIINIAKSHNVDIDEAMFVNKDSR